MGTVLGCGAVLFMHFAATFLYLAPANPVQERSAAVIERYMRPYFNQDWQLFAPHPIDYNLQILVRGRIRPGGTPERVTPWLDVTEPAAATVRGHLFPERLFRVVRGGYEMLSQTGLDPAEKGDAGQAAPLDPSQQQAVRYVAALGTAAARARWGDDVSAIQIRVARRTFPAFAQRHGGPADQVVSRDFGWQAPVPLSQDAVIRWKGAFE